jgi:hypothetical protein
MDFDQVTEMVTAGMLQGFIVAFVGLAAFLPASYVMNRYIYRSWTMRAFMGLIAALTGLGGLVILVLMRLYWGDSMLIHYFGMLPILTKVEDSAVSKDRSWIMSAIVWLFSPLMPPLTFYYDNKEDQDGYAATIETLMSAFKNGEQTERGDLAKAEGLTVHEQTVYEPLFEFARTVGHVRADTSDKNVWDTYMTSNSLPVDTKKYNYAGLGAQAASKIGEALLA